MYIDTDTRTPFPANAAIPIDRIFAALEEFHQTGERPTCVDLAGIGRARSVRPCPPDEAPR
ncbi:Imm1 family immunity protein [Lentzea sp.]|uniref:Imm1 family immunity protein n=1 Tax=Lentzea sp. TaxID=56099 RepID=UPI0039C9B27B